MEFKVLFLSREILRSFILLLSVLRAVGALAEPERVNNIHPLQFTPSVSAIDPSGVLDSTVGFAEAIKDANAVISSGWPSCVHIPTGVFRILQPLPQFTGAGCIIGMGPTQSIIKLDKSFSGDLFSWSEAWEGTVPGPTIVGFKVVGDRTANGIQNVFVFYDRNDEVFIDNIVVTDVPGRVLYSGIRKFASQAYMREAHIRSLRFFRDGAPGHPVIEFNSQGSGRTDATNEIRMSQIDVYGSYGQSFLIHNEGDGYLRYITVDSLRIEGLERGDTKSDLLTIGDLQSVGRVGALTFSNVELIDPYRGFAAIKITAGVNNPVPNSITVQGLIDGGLAFGEGVRLEAAQNVVLTFSKIHTGGTNIIMGPRANHVVIDGKGLEGDWTFEMAPDSINQLYFPSYTVYQPKHRTNAP